ncbi:MAG: hypothetical protein QOK23_2021 [Gammaproteobacteria bacterium]|jgi:hypothetical protein|nr:hypothetical protein [Gammaproteobacteria bacterium]MEA3139852.1 hypothetical protein [Gammaproteobacteria bacterium]
MLKPFSFIRPFLVIKLARPVPLVAEKIKPGARVPGASNPVKKCAWHAVSIARGRPACAAVGQLHGRRWLSTQAPHLPVQGCNTAECTCRYRHHEDRRVQDRREASVLVSSPPPKGGERRSPRTDRRSQNSIQ